MPHQRRLNATKGDWIEPGDAPETADEILMVETKARNELGTEEVLAKKAAAKDWCRHATAYSAEHNGKAWRYVLLAHDQIATNMTLRVLADGR